MTATTMASATDLWEGTHAVNWDNTLTIGADKFADALVGQKIVIEFTNATGEVIELHSNGVMLPGTRYEHHLYADQSAMEVFITTGMLARLKESGLEICGTGFTATKAWYGDGKDNVNGMAAVAKKLSEWCGKYTNTYAFYVQLTQAAIDPSVAKVIDICDNEFVVDASKGIPVFGSFDNGLIIYANTLHLDKIHASLVSSRSSRKALTCSCMPRVTAIRPERVYCSTHS